MKRGKEVEEEEEEERHGICLHKETNQEGRKVEGMKSVSQRTTADDGTQKERKEV